MTAAQRAAETNRARHRDEIRELTARALAYQPPARPTFNLPYERMREAQLIAEAEAEAEARRQQ